MGLYLAGLKKLNLMTRDWLVSSLYANWQIDFLGRGMFTQGANDDCIPRTICRMLARSEWGILPGAKTQGACNWRKTFSMWLLYQAWSVLPLSSLHLADHSPPPVLLLPLVSIRFRQVYAFWQSFVLPSLVVYRQTICWAPVSKLVFVARQKVSLLVRQSRDFIPGWYVQERVIAF